MIKFLFLLLISSTSLFAQIAPVSQGDPIKAELMNSLINEINLLKIDRIYVKATTIANVIAHSVDVPIVFNGTEIDASNSFNPATGIFTAPRNGRYEVIFNYWLSSAAWTAGNYHYVHIERSGSIVSYCPIVGMPVSTMYTGGSCHDFIELVQGQTLQLKMRQNRGAPVTLDGGDQYNRLIISEYR